MTTTEKLSEIKLYYKPRRTVAPRITCSTDVYKQVLKFYDKNTIALQEQFIIIYLMSCPEIALQQTIQHDRKRAKKGKINPKSSQPYKRRTEEEMINILIQIQNGSLSK